MRLEREGVGWVQIPCKVESIPGRLVCARIEKRSRILFESAEERYVRQWKAQAFFPKAALLSTAHDGRGQLKLVIGRAFAYGT